MKRTLILTLSVLAAALMVCAFSLTALNATVGEAGRLASLAVLEAEEGRAEDAGDRLVALAQHWRDRAALMEVLASHDALHDVDTAIAEAQICLECGDRDEFLRAMSNLTMALNHLTDEEAVRWENLY